MDKSSHLTLPQCWYSNECLVYHIYICTNCTVPLENINLRKPLTDHNNVYNYSHREWKAIFNLKGQTTNGWVKKKKEVIICWTKMYKLLWKKTVNMIKYLVGINIQCEHTLWKCPLESNYYIVIKKMQRAKISTAFPLIHTWTRKQTKKQYCFPKNIKVKINGNMMNCSSVLYTFLNIKQIHLKNTNCSWDIFMWTDCFCQPTCLISHKQTLKLIHKEVVQVKSHQFEKKKKNPAVSVPECHFIMLLDSTIFYIFFLFCLKENEEANSWF